MTRSGLKRLILLCIICFFLLSCLPIISFCQENIVKAKIGILIDSKGKRFLAKSKSRIKAGDLLRLYVQPLIKSYVYIVYSNKDEVIPIMNGDLAEMDTIVELPPPVEFFQIDGQHSMEHFTIICSPNKLDEISAMETSEDGVNKWATILAKWVETSKIPLSKKSEANFYLAGNIRGAKTDLNKDSIVGKSHTYSGKSMVIHQYEFKVKK